MDLDILATTYSACVERLLEALGIGDTRHVTSVHIDLLPNDLVTIRVLRVATSAQLDALAAELEATPLAPR